MRASETSATVMQDLFQFGCFEGADAQGRHTGNFGSGASSDELLKGDQRLEHTPVEDHRQATTGASLGGASIHLF